MPQASAVLLLADHEDELRRRQLRLRDTEVIDEGWGVSDDDLSLGQTLAAFMFGAGPAEEDEEAEEHEADAYAGTNNPYRPYKSQEESVLAMKRRLREERTHKEEREKAKSGAEEALTQAKQVLYGWQCCGVKFSGRSVAGQTDTPSEVFAQDECHRLAPLVCGMLEEAPLKMCDALAEALVRTFAMQPPLWLSLKAPCPSLP